MLWAGAAVLELALPPVRSEKVMNYLGRALKG